MWVKPDFHFSNPINDVKHTWELFIILSILDGTTKSFNAQLLPQWTYGGEVFEHFLMTNKNVW